MFDDINKIIADYMMGRASEEQRQMLEKRMLEDAAFCRKMKELLDSNELCEAWKVVRFVDDEKALRNLRGKLGIAEKDSEAKTPLLHQLYVGLRAVAAVALLLVVVGVAFWYNDYTSVIPPVTPEHPAGELFVKTADSAVTRRAETPCVAYRYAVKKSDLKGLRLDAATVNELLKSENITTYKNKEYWVTLPDGTSVHLNDNSRIIYPEHFAKATPWNPHPVREVVLQGEAYFMVAKDKSRGFVVHTIGGDVVDYGTEFYVSATSDEHNHQLKVALIKGKVGVKARNMREKILAPGEEAVVDADGMKVQSIDTAPYEAWHTGIFSFEGYTLESIMEVVSMWYEVDVEFENDRLRNCKFDGVLSRYEPLDNVLKSLNLVMNLKIHREGERIVVR